MANDNERNRGGGGKRMETENGNESHGSSIVYSILRMSQKALMFVLALIGVGYIGGVIAIVFEPWLAEPLAQYSQIFIPLFQLEIGVYGLGSTLENVQKIRGQIDRMNGKQEKNDAETDTAEELDGNG
jgi:hypothetical protein